MRWEAVVTPAPNPTLYDVVCRIGRIIEEARGLELPDEWTNQTRDWLLERDPLADTAAVGFHDVLTAFRALGYIGEEGQCTEGTT